MPPPPHVPPPPRVPPATPVPPASARVAAKVVDLGGVRPLPSIERALSGHDDSSDTGWGRKVKVVTGGQGPGKRDQESHDRDRARLPLPGPRLITVLGCTSGAGQTVTTLMTGHILAAVREVPVAAVDLNPGEGSLTTRIPPAVSVTALLAGEAPDAPAADHRKGLIRTRLGRGDSRARLEVIGTDPDVARALAEEDYRRLAGLLAESYPLAIVDPAPSGLTRVLSVTDQLVLVAPASPDAATSLANTQAWLGAHGYGELAALAVTLINGVSRQTMDDVLRAESVARGRCRAIVRVPWDDQLPVWTGSPAALLPQTRHAYTALAGVLMAGMAAQGHGTAQGQGQGQRQRQGQGRQGPAQAQDAQGQGTAQRQGAAEGRSPGEHTD
jgi:MinD-like ATPase involved in chromosome partitioning or flagellar assembly